MGIAIICITYYLLALNIQKINIYKYFYDSEKTIR